MHSQAGERYVGNVHGVVLTRLDGLGQAEADLLHLEVERGHELHVRNVVVTQLHMLWPVLRRRGQRSGSTRRAIRDEAQLPAPTIATRIGPNPW